MEYSRRGLSLILPALAVAANASAQNGVLPSKICRFEDLPVRTIGPNSYRAVFSGKTLSGVAIDAHLTELAPGESLHPPHHHIHEEMILIHQATLEVTIAGRGSNLGPGSVAYVASNEPHGWRNVGTTRALYLVLAFGRDNA